MRLSASICFYGLLFTVVFLAEVWRVDCSSDGCPDIVLRSGYFAKVYNTTCYLFVDRERYWEGARDSCLGMGGEMLSVNDHGTMAFIRSVLNSKQLGWNKRGVWLGARYSGGRWRWTSGEPVGYANWAPGEPSKILGIFSVEDCALMRRRHNWHWHDYICGGMKYHFNYICQFPVEIPPTTTTTTTTTLRVASTLEVEKDSKKGHFMDRTDSKMGSQGSYHQYDQMGEETGALDNGVPSHPYNVQNRVPGNPYERHPGELQKT